MEPEIVQGPAGWVLGIEARINPREADYRDLWENRFMPRHEEIRSVAVDHAYYGVYYPTDEPGKADFVAGMMVEERSEVPPGLVRRTLPGGLHAAVRCTMSSIGATWNEIYGRWLPSSEYREDESRPAIEYFPPEMSGPDAELRIFLPLKPKG